MYFFINVKSYEKSLGSVSKEIVKVILKNNTKAKFVLCPQIVELEKYSKKVSCFAQHFDPVTANKNTGFTTIKAIKFAGAKGSIINHSEHRIPPFQIKNAIELCKKEKIKSLLCVKDKKELIKYAYLTPDFIAIEPPELIGGEVSISTAKPELIKNCVIELKKITNKTKLIIGAGINDKNDITVAKKLGAKGILIASHIVFAKDINKKIIELM